jgi:hypothetical protein
VTRHTAPTAGAAIDQGLVTSCGWQADVHVTAVEGGEVVLTVQDSADGEAWADLAGATSVAFAAPGAQRMIGDPTATVRRHVRAVSSGSFTAASFVVSFVRHEEPQDYAGPLFTPMVMHAPTGVAPEGTEATAPVEAPAAPKAGRRR